MVIKNILSKFFSPDRLSGVFYFDNHLDNMLRVLEKNKNSKLFSRTIYIWMFFISRIGVKLRLPNGRIIKNGIFQDSKNYGFFEKEIFNSVFLYELFIGGDYFSPKEKAKLDFLFLQSLMGDVVLSNFKGWGGNGSCVGDDYLSGYLREKALDKTGYLVHDEIEKIINRGFIFGEEKEKILSLYYLLGYRDLHTYLNDKQKVFCYEMFGALSLRAKKMLISFFVKARSDEVVFNLLRYGVSLDWEINIEKKKNILGFVVLYSKEWLRALLDNKGFDLTTKNREGENLLHCICGSSAVEDDDILSGLYFKISSLSNEKRDEVINQVNRRGFSPMMSALIFQDVQIIDMLLFFGYKPWHTHHYSKHGSSLDFLNNYILNGIVDDIGEREAIMLKFFKGVFWEDLAKRWGSEKLFEDLKKSLVGEEEIPKRMKI